MKGAVCDLLQPQAVQLHTTDPQHKKENGPHKQGIKPSTRVVYYTVTFKQRSLITGSCVYPGMLEQEGHIKPPVIQKESDVIQVYPYI